MNEKRRKFNVEALNYPIMDEYTFDISPIKLPDYDNKNNGIPISGYCVRDLKYCGASEIFTNEEDAERNIFTKVKQGLIDKIREYEEQLKNLKEAKSILDEQGIKSFEI
jgi:hypothetical protein